MMTTLNILKRDLIRSGRDSILLYIILSPILLAIIALVVLPNFTDPSYDLLVDVKLEAELDLSSINSKSISWMSEKEIVAKIESDESYIGILGEGDGYIVVTTKSAVNSTSTYINEKLIPLLDGEEVVRNRDNSVIEGYTVVLLIMTTLLLGGMAAGLLIVDERATKTIQTTAITPVTIGTYMLAKALMSFVIPLIMGVVISLIVVGFRWSLSIYLLASISGFPLGIIFALVTGYFADNQISALGVVKLLMPLFLTIPVVSLVVPKTFIWIFYIFPNYWVFELLKVTFITGYETVLHPIWGAVISLILGGGILLYITPKSAKRFGLK